ncbi:hypothetical protein Bbelb_187150 [Branchiostoma belcheri]|nr:hypothetical protein Bbelb_187150 [Branchiostoma belcheri]
MDGVDGDSDNETWAESEEKNTRTPVFINEDFSELVRKRRAELVPLKAARQRGDCAVIIYDRLVNQIKKEMPPLDRQPAGPPYMYAIKCAQSRASRKPWWDCTVHMDPDGTGKKGTDKMKQR